VRLPRYLAAWPEEHRRIDDPLIFIDRASMIVVKGRYTPVQEISVRIAQQARGMVERIMYRSKSGDDEYYLELKRWGVHKGSALRFLAGHLGVPLARFGAIGDYANDLEMCKAAGVSVAMRNGIDELKKRADMVTLQSNNEDGVAEFLDAVRLAQSQGT
jgi:hydroxymethylpyrimidine pyrophosphatase-like HAD family hydrolase